MPVRLFFLILIIGCSIFSGVFADDPPPNEITSITSAGNISFTKNNIVDALFYNTPVVKTLATACVYTDNIDGDFDLLASAPINYYGNDNFKMYSPFLGSVDYTLQVKSSNASTPIDLLPNIALPLTNHANARGLPCNNELILQAKFNPLAVRNAQHGSYTISFSLSAANFTG